jgi:surfactin synthase thioesterase subunit
VPRSGTRWLVQEPPPGVPLLLAFPFAGAGASSLRRWPSRIGDVTVAPVMLPGRDYRIKEPPYEDFDAFAKDAVEALGPYLGQPFAVIGHCMGALLAHSFTAYAVRNGVRPPERLFVSASLVPSRGFYGYYHPWMSDERIVQELRRVADDLGDGPVPDELVRLSVRVLRSDVRMCLGHAPPAADLGVPVTAIGWSDDPDVSVGDLSEWRAYGPTEEHVLPGDPLRFLTAPAGLLQLIEEDLAGAVERTGQ